MQEKEPCLRLRGHHLICLHFYRGEGYSADFIFNLEKLLERAKMGSEIEVASGADDVCTMCPHQNAGKCLYGKNADTEIAQMDRKALALLGFGVGDTGLKWKDVAGKIPAIISIWSAGYCKNCDWKRVCQHPDVSPGGANIGAKHVIE